jgi:lysophospholipase L1-like esterase
MNKILIWIIVLGFSLSHVYGQNKTTPYSERAYPYIMYDSTALEHFDSNPNLNKFYDKLDKLYFKGIGQVSILHFGGSHIQAGIWSLELRKRFESLMLETEGAPGFVFPFSIAKTNHPFYYTSKSTGDWEISKITDKEPADTLGLIGIAAVTRDSLSSIMISFNSVAEVKLRKFDKVSVFHNIEDTSYLIRIIPENLIDTIIINYETRATEFYLKKTVDTLNFEFIRQDTSENIFCFYGAYLENTMPGIKYSGVGINGASTFSYLKADLFKTHLKAIMPDLVIFSIGVNDAAGKTFSKFVYISNYKRLVDKILEVNPDCAFIFTTNNDFYNYRGGVNPHYGAVYEAMASLGSKYNASVWNMFKAMGGYKSINYWRNDKIANRDRIHFTRSGYRIIAGLLFDAIMEDYEKHLVGKQQNEHD